MTCEFLQRGHADGIATVIGLRHFIIGDLNMAGLYGFTPEQTLNSSSKVHMAHIHPADHQTLRTAIEKALVIGTLTVPEYRVGKSENSMRWVTGRGTVQYDPQGEPEAMSGLVIDIEDRKAMEEALMTEDRQKDMLNRIPHSA